MKDTAVKVIWTAGFAFISGVLAYDMILSGKTDHMKTKSIEKKIEYYDTMIKELNDTNEVK